MKNCSIAMSVKKKEIEKVCSCLVLNSTKPIVSGILKIPYNLLSFKGRKKRSTSVFFNQIGVII